MCHIRTASASKLPAHEINTENTSLLQCKAILVRGVGCLLK